MKYNKIITLLILTLALLSMAFIGGCRQADPCEREYNNCVHECGEGILSSVCKEKCTYDRSECQNSD